MSVKAVIFDMDGTLVDSVDLHARAWHEALKRFGYDFPYEEVRGQIGKGGDQLMPYFVPQQDLEKIEKDLESYRKELFKTQYQPKIVPLEGGKPLFLRLKQGGKRTGLATSSAKDDLEHNKNLAGISDLVDAQSTADDAERSKPHPDIFEAVLEKLRIPGDDAIAVGDSPYDAEAAGKAGLRTIGFLSGGFAEEDLRRAGCIEIYDGPADLLARIDQSAIG